MLVQDVGWGCPVNNQHVVVGSSQKKLKFSELYNELSAEGFSPKEKNALTNIKHYEAEVEALEKFLNPQHQKSL